MNDFAQRFEKAFSLRVALRLPSELIGPTPEGLRANFYVAGGAFDGPRLRGKLRPVGGDWFLVRRDGVGVLDVRCTLETDDGALVLGAHQGLVDLGPKGFEEAARGAAPRRLEGHVAARYQSAHESTLWVNRTLFIGAFTIDLDASEVRYEMYAPR